MITENHGLSVTLEAYESVLHIEQHKHFGWDWNMYVARILDVLPLATSRAFYAWAWYRMPVVYVGVLKLSWPAKQAVLSTLIRLCRWGGGRRTLYRSFNKTK